MPSSNHMGSNTSNVRPRSIALKRGCKHYRAASGRLPLGIAKRTPPRLPMPMNLAQQYLEQRKVLWPQHTCYRWCFLGEWPPFGPSTSPCGQPVMTCPEMIDGLLRASNARETGNLPGSSIPATMILQDTWWRRLELITKVQVVSRGCFERLRRVFKRWRRPMNQICSFHKPNILLLGMRKMCLST